LLTRSASLSEIVLTNGAGIAMPMESIRIIEDQIRKLQADAAALKAKAQKRVIRLVVKLMLENDVSIEEVGTAVKKKKARIKNNSKLAIARKPAAIKYRNPATNETWTGKGRTPHWITAAEAAGKDRKGFAV
jgi:DNA-binding protein H-NS